MPLTTYILEEFDHPHEVKMFSALEDRLRQSKKLAGESGVLAANLAAQGAQIDALYLSPNRICTIEMKNVGGRIRFAENGPWDASGVEIRGNLRGNPMRQALGQRLSLASYLENRNKIILAENREANWLHIGAILLFGQKIDYDSSEEPPSYKKWFRACDLDGAADAIHSVTSNELRLSPLEIERTLTALGFTPRTEKNSPKKDRAKPQPIAKFPEDSDFGGTTRPTNDLGKKTSTAPRAFVCLHEDSDFRNSLHSLQDQTGSAGLAHRKIKEGLEKSPLQFLQESRPCTHAANCERMAVTPEYDLVILRCGEIVVPMFVGKTSDVDAWEVENSTINLVVDANGKQFLNAASNSFEDPKPLRTPIATRENAPLLSRLEGIDLAKVIENPRLRKMVQSITEDQWPTRAVEVLELVDNSHTRSGLFDILNDLGQGKLESATARWKMMLGQAVPASHAPGIAAEHISSPQNSARVIIWEKLSEHEREILFDRDRFHEWMLLLSSDQERFADASFEKPTLLAGASGSGKTCILVHRAVRLSRRYPDQRIAILTLNRSLVGLLKNLVRTLSGDSGENITVLAFYDYFRELLLQFGAEVYLDLAQQRSAENPSLRSAIKRIDPRNFVREFDPRNGESLEDTWNEFYLAQNPDLSSRIGKLVDFFRFRDIELSRYIREEFELIRSAIPDARRRVDYPEFRRKGRAFQIQKGRRQEILDLLDDYEEHMYIGHMLDLFGLSQALHPVDITHESIPDKLRYRCLLVDEYQDLSTIDMNIVRRAASAAENGLFLTGDPVQKVLVKHLSLKSAGLDDFEKHNIAKNYRNGREILAAASTLANHYTEKANSSQGEEIEFLDPELAARSTPKPRAVKTDKQIHRAWEIAREHVNQFKSRGCAVCVATVSPAKITPETLLEESPQDIEVQILGPNYMEDPEAFVVAAVEDLKGFEFSAVVLVGCSRILLPSPNVHPDEDWREALRFYVGMTRATHEVHMVFEGNPSEFLEVMKDEITFVEEPCGPAYKARGAIKPPEVETMTDTPRPAQPRLSRRDRERSMPIPDLAFPPDVLAMLRRYHEAFVREGSFPRWLTPENLEQVSREQLLSLPKNSKRVAKKLERDLSLRKIRIQK